MKGTEQIYLADSYQKSAEAKIIDVGKSGTNDYIILDQTIFYPQGGGQPSDKGAIKSRSGSMNIKTVEYNGGLIKHIGITKEKLQIGDIVTLALDWNLRLKHMKWHTAGHLVDEAVTELHPSLAPKKGVHGIGNKLYIEYEGLIPKNSGKKIESLVNKLRQDNLSIKTKLVTIEELKKISSWIPSNLPKNKKLRVMQIGDRKVLPDGGTQLASTGELDKVEITSILSEQNTTQIHYHVLSDKPSHNTVSQNPANILDIKTQLAELNNSFAEDFDLAIKSGNFQSIHNKYLSKKSGLTNNLLKLLPSLSPSDKKKYGPLLNHLKSSQIDAIEKAEVSHSQSLADDPTIDLTTPRPPLSLGHLHPTTEMIRQLNDFFHYYGYSVLEGPEIETAEYNFRRLNLPEGHPATDLQDTLFIKEPDLLLRTHTSSVEARVLTKYDPPIRVVVPGKVYRNETANKTNSSFFHQYQGFVVDKGITIQHLKSTLELAHKFLFGDDVVLRFRYKYYPEVSPGMGVDMRCQFCNGAGCEVCKHRGYIEMLGSGMIHFNTLKSCGIDPEVYTGFAFGMGLDRFVMSKYGVSDIRRLYGEELTYR